MGLKGGNKKELLELPNNINRPHRRNWIKDRKKEKTIAFVPFLSWETDIYFSI